MNRQVSPVVGAVIIVIVVVVLVVAGYKLFLEPEKPRWSPQAGYGAPTYGQPMNAPSQPR